MDHMVFEHLTSLNRNIDAGLTMRGLGRTRLASARRARHEVWALSKRNLLESQSETPSVRFHPCGQHRSTKRHGIPDDRDPASRPSMY